mmetsp:Transcript_21568/g.60032  ORF Transcript_21568/g.60032 Transcript_21568/m.60032 type:complete len:480 (-) Transcript_21568:603-2042(-)
MTYHTTNHATAVAAAIAIAASLFMACCIPTVAAADGDPAPSIPCPGVEDGVSFNNIALKDRPKLAKILQHGYRMDLQKATMPSFEVPGNQVDLHTAFVDRRFRLIDAEHCNPIYATVPGQYVTCSKQTSSSFASTNGRSLNVLLEKQLLLQASAQYDGWHMSTHGIRSASDEVKASYNEWVASTTQILENSYTCDDWEYLHIFHTKFVCNYIPACMKLEPEFLQDLKALPTPSIIGPPTSVSSISNTADVLNQLNATLAKPYFDFVDKWGHGLVESFSLGSAVLEVRSSASEPVSNSDSTLYMGYVGGSGIKEIRQGNLDADLYTQEECNDPEPMRLNYRRWSTFLGTDPYFNLILPPADRIDNREDLIRNFQFLYLYGFDLGGAYSVSRDIVDSDAWQCNATSPDPDPDVGQPTQAPDNGATDGPTAAPTDQDGNATSSDDDEDSDDSAAVSLSMMSSVGLKFITVVATFLAMMAAAA